LQLTASGCCCCCGCCRYSPCTWVSVLFCSHHLGLYSGLATSVAAAAASDISLPSCCVPLTFTHLSCYSHRLHRPFARSFAACTSALLASCTRCIVAYLRPQCHLLLPSILSPFLLCCTSVVLLRCQAFTLNFAYTYNTLCNFSVQCCVILIQMPEASVLSERRIW